MLLRKRCTTDILYYIDLIINYLNKRRVGGDSMGIRQVYLFEVSDSVVARGLGQPDVKN